MIDPHVHLRDWEQSAKETLLHGMRCAADAGITGLFEMPNTLPVLTGREVILKRIEAAEAAVKASGIRTYGLYAGLTNDASQRAQMLSVYDELFPTVIGFKLFAGHSTGNMGITEEGSQLAIYRQLAQAGYEGILALHCEKESLLHPELWDPAHPETHGIARPPEAELASVVDQISYARKSGFKGILHVCHVSHPHTVEYLESVREEGLSFRITCGLTPHHALLNSDDADHSGNLSKMNPPLRDRASQQRMYEMLSSGRIDWIESDHAPHTLDDKVSGASGIPGFSGYLRLVAALQADGVADEQLTALTGGNFLKTVGHPHIVDSIPEISEQMIRDAADSYPWDPFS